MTKIRTTVGNNPFTGHTVTRVRMGLLDLSYDGDTLMVFGRGRHKGWCFNFGWHADAEAVRAELASAIESAGQDTFVEWAAGVTPDDPESTTITYSVAGFTAWLAEREQSSAESPAGEVPPVELVEVTMPYSEVCMHMRIAGKPMLVEALPNGMAQLYSLDGSKFSFPITQGEAGLRLLAEREQSPESPGGEVIAIWHGGASYTDGGLDYAERFPNVEAAGDALVDRERDGYGFRQEFNFLHRPPASALTPAVDARTTRMDLYSGDPMAGGELVGRLIIGLDGKATTEDF